MSQDNENKPDDLDFDFLANADTDDQSSDIVNPFTDDENFNPFGDSGFAFPDDAAQPVAAETAVPPEEDANSLAADDLEMSAPSPFLADESAEVTENSEAEETAEPKENKKKGFFSKFPSKGSKKEAKKKEDKPKPEKKKREKKERQAGSKEPMELGAKLSLALGGVLLIALLAVNILLIVYPPYKGFGVGFTSIIYYLVGIDVIGGIGLVAVPFMFCVYQKDIDVFKVLLGVSTMALSLGVILMMTAFMRYDFSAKTVSPLPQLVKPNLTQGVPAE